MKTNNVAALDSHLWRACAGKTVQIPAEGSTVYYFPQGHAENANCPADFAIGLPAILLCLVESVKLAADSETDEVFASLTLRPIASDSGAEIAVSDEAEQFSGASFAKVLTQSDANNGGGFSVPRHCADTVFPALNYAADPPVQELVARDVHGELWKFRHIYRGTPRRHLLTSGWSVFVNKKRLVARDSIVFVRSDSGEICVGIRRARRSAAQVRVRTEEFTEAARMAAMGEAFEAVFYPRDGAAEFCVKSSVVRAAMAEQWRCGTRMKMAVEDETTSRVKACNGAVTAVQVLDPVRWPNSPWRALQVSWDDEPDKLQNPQRVSPWMIEMVSSMPVYPPFPLYEPQRKKVRTEDLSDITLNGMSPAAILGNALGPNNSNPAGIQGARHFVFEVPLSELNMNDQLQLQLVPPGGPLLNQQSSSVPNSVVAGQLHDNGSLSCLVAVQESTPDLEWAGGEKRHRIYLFGKALEQLRNHSSSSTDAATDLCRKSTSNENSVGREKLDNDGPETSPVASGLGLKIGCCKVLKEYADMGWTIDLSVVGSYEELYKSLSNEFKIERSAITTCVYYHDATGAPKQTGDQPFSDFIKIAKRLTIIPDPKKKKDDGKKD